MTASKRPSLFPRSARLLRPAQFERVLKAPDRRLRVGSLQALWRANSSAAGARLGLIVGKRHLPRAVQRNRLKRHLREAFRRERVALPAIDLVVRLAAKPAREHPAEVIELFGRLQQQVQRQGGGLKE